MKGSIKYVTQVGDGPIKETILNTELENRFNVSEQMEKHAMQALEDTEMLVFTKGPRGGKEYESDTFRLENPICS